MKKKVFLICITIIFLFISIYSLIHIFFWHKENAHTTELIEEINDTIIVNEETNENENEIEIDFTKLKSKNKNTIGWIIVKNTNIDYPFVQYKDNDYYLNHSFDNKYSNAGWIFMDYRNKNNFTDKNTIIYAHARKDKTMFGTLKNTLTKKWYKNKDNHIITITLENEKLYYQVFSSYHIKTEDYYITTSFKEADFNKFINTIKKRSVYNYNIDVTNKDYILTLSTCYNNTDKTVVHAKLLNREIKKVD